MYEYGPYNNNPYPGATPQMQQRLNALQQQQVYRQQNQPTNMYQSFQPTIKGRAVTSIDEARAAMVDLDGTSNFFPSPAEGKIYEKLIGMDGLPIFRVYVLQPEAPVQRQAYADNNLVAALQRRIERLEQQVGGMNNDEHIPDDADGTASRKSNGANAAARRTKSANGQSDTDGTR